MRKFAVGVALAAVSLAAQIPLPPAPQKYVTDAAGVLDDDREHALNEKLAEHERRTTNQVIVYVDRHVPEGTTIEEMGAEAIRTWGVGQAKVDNGAILFLFIDDRESRIEVGYGLEGVLTDALSKRILVDMRPLLREADYMGAVEQGVQAIFDAIASPQPAVEPQAVMPPQPEPRPARNFGPAIAGLFVLFLLVIIIKLLKDSRSFIQPNMTAFPPDDAPGDSWTTFESSSSSSSSSFPSSSWDSSSSSSPSSSSSSSDFTGGGGSGGGGGASDKW